MAMTDHFTSMGAVKAERLRLKAERDAHAQRLGDAFAQLKEPGTIKAMGKQVLSTVLHGITPRGILGNLLGAGGVMKGVQMAVGRGKGGWMQRGALFLLGLAAPAAMQKAENISFADVKHELGITVDRFKEYFRNRKQRRREERERAETP